MRKVTAFLVLLFLILCPVFVNAGDFITLDSLDRVVEKRKFYMTQKEEKIDKVRKKISFASTEPELYDLQREMYYEYQTYRSDSAMKYVERNLEMAIRLDSIHWRDEMEIARSFLDNKSLLRNKAWKKHIGSL